MTRKRFPMKTVFPFLRSIFPLTQSNEFGLGSLGRSQARVVNNLINGNGENGLVIYGAERASAEVVNNKRPRYLHSFLLLMASTISSVSGCLVESVGDPLDQPTESPATIENQDVRATRTEVITKEFSAVVSKKYEDRDFVLSAISIKYEVGGTWRGETPFLRKTAIQLRLRQTESRDEVLKTVPFDQIKSVELDYKKLLFVIRRDESVISIRQLPESENNEGRFIFSEKDQSGREVDHFAFGDWDFDGGGGVEGMTDNGIRVEREFNYMFLEGKAENGSQMSIPMYYLKKLEMSD